MSRFAYLYYAISILATLIVGFAIADHDNPSNIDDDEVLVDCKGSSLSTVHSIYTPKDRDCFVEGTDAWEALNAGESISLDRYGFIVRSSDLNEDKHRRR